MTDILAEVKIPSRSGMVEDTVVNAFAFHLSQADPATAASGLDGILTAFYNADVGVTSRSIAKWMAADRDRGADKCSIDYYNITGHLDGSAHGSPVRHATWTLVARINDGLVDFPDEVAVCLSYHSAYGTDLETAGNTRPRARDRGRIYIGPLGAGVANSDVNASKIVSSTYRDVVTGAAETLRASIGAIGGGNYWGVWSRAGAAIKAVTGGWVDDAFDIQRRRGIKPTTRTTFGS